MNYLKTYLNLIRKAERRTPLVCDTERHHIFPISIFGKNNRVVTLTYREHYIAHALLEKICIKRYGLNHSKTRSMIYAFLMMNNQSEKYFNSHLYEGSRIRVSEAMSGENNPNYGKPPWNKGRTGIYTEEQLKKMSEAMSGENNPMYGKTGEKCPNYGRKHTPEELKRMSGKTPWNKGRTGVYTEEQRKKKSESMKKYWENKKSMI